MRNEIKRTEILNAGASVAEHQAAKILFKDREMWLDKTVDKENRDMLTKLRSFNIHTEQRAYEDTLQVFLSKYFKDRGAKAVPTEKSILPNICFSDCPMEVALSEPQDNAFGTSVKLATYNNPILTYNNMIIGMYDQITPTNVSPIMTDFPEAMYPAVGLYIPSWAPITGMTMEHENGQPFYNQPKREVDYQFYKTEPFAEKVVYYQDEVIGLRQPDSNIFMDRGLPLYMTKNMSMIEHRRQTRNIFNIYRAIYDGIVYYNGNALSYNISPVNRITGTQLAGAPWATFSSTGSVTAFGNVNIPQAFRNLVHAVLRRYVGYGLRIYMNSITLSAIIGNPSITPITNFGPAFQVGQNKGLGNDSQLENVLRQFLGTNAKIDIVIDDSQYYPDGFDPLGRAASTTTSYYLNDVGKFVICPQVQATGAGMGEYAYTPIVQNGGMLYPQPGAAFFMIDTFASNTVEGMENPTLAQALRFSAIPLIFRNKDIFTVDITQ